MMLCHFCINWEFFYFPAGKTFWDYLPAFTGIISAVATVLTFRLALKIFKNQDAKKALIKLQIEEVINFQNIFENTQLVLRVTEGGSSIVHILPLSHLNEEMKQQNYYSNLFSTKDFIIDYEAFVNLKFTNYHSVYSIPEPVRKELKELATHIKLTTFKMNDDKDSVYLSSVENYAKDESERKLSFFADVKVDSPYFISFESFLDKIISIRKETKLFYNQFGISN